MSIQYRERTDHKLAYARIHAEELKTYPNATSNDEWENAHQESFFYHLAGSVEALLHEINEAYALGLALDKVSFERVSTELLRSGQSSPAFDGLESLREDKSSWLSLLFEWRHHGTHRAHVGKVVNFSTHRRVDNEFKDPRSGLPQNVYAGMSCLDIIDRMLSNVAVLLRKCRTEDPKLCA
jgi:hypothetical protein